MTSALPRWYHAVSDVGREREINEDAHAEYALGDGTILLVVADGMGGHEAGEVASRIAVEAIGHIVQNSPADDPREKLRNAFLVANQRILTEAERKGTQGMGTTAVAAYVQGDRAFVAHVGDSRLYHIRDGEVRSRTLDHTRVQKMVELGILQATDAKQHPDANVVTRALGHARLADGSALDPEVRPEPFLLAPGDSLVLCTDGLYDGVADEEIAQGIEGRTADEAAHALVALANERGGHDNITVTVLHYGAERGKRPAGRRTTRGYPPPRRLVLGGLAGLAGVALAGLAIFWGSRDGGGGAPPPRAVPDLAVAPGAVSADPEHDGGLAVPAVPPPSATAGRPAETDEPPREPNRLDGGPAAPTIRAAAGTRDGQLPTTRSSAPVGAKKPQSATKTPAAAAKTSAAAPKTAPSGTQVTPADAKPAQAPHGTKPPPASTAPTPTAGTKHVAPTGTSPSPAKGQPPQHPAPVKSDRPAKDPGGGNARQGGKKAP